jgi:hypothetical protein
VHGEVAADLHVLHTWATTVDASLPFRQGLASGDNHVCAVCLQLAAAQEQLLVAGQALGAGVQVLLLLCK